MTLVVQQGLAAGSQICTNVSRRSVLEAAIGITDAIDGVYQPDFHFFCRMR
jgi:hypothetical protein